MNNRQAGRRRGRGGQRQGGNPGRPDNGNRIDNRARGNAAQLLEKYKNLAADAQRAGDRVNTEYYLQFADHYFRVLAETRSRAEENGQVRRQRDDEMDDDGEDFGFEGDIASPAHYQQASEDGERQDRQERPRRDYRDNRENRDGGERAPRADREARPRRDRDAGDQGQERPRRQPREMTVETASEDRPAPIPANDEPRRTRRPRRETVQRETAQDTGDSNGFDAALLPPAISTDPVVSVASGDETPAERPRRGRPRRVRTEDEAIPPAA
ncbi:hypothetical protein ASE86_15525 [Sphingomonas sp. Leaf33]|uniref:DUF4167 domain-containing protein n=1 Tax=Sphingomonas sp. Leaf33 TaxID=1736215 RepID=UPI00070231B8|nr:DUF4167 domain-containing protein [Sphingomonas sp. Leaf33]KQN20650.1 hypothetical protein ASE86_15525 [Sphingomonas sp. Leaf33]